MAAQYSSAAAPADRDLDLRRELEEFLVSPTTLSPSYLVPVVSPGFPAFFNDLTTAQTWDLITRTRRNITEKNTFPEQ